MIRQPFGLLGAVLMGISVERPADNHQARYWGST
jgi:hypothetical protein